jgi:8-oxo-dGTP pyrophosphatase MutT (NUDIX family)
MSTTSPDGSPTAAPRDAATLIPVRDGPDGIEVLLTRRPETMAFAPGMHVFPGGRLDHGDADPRVAGRSALALADAAERLAEALDPAAALAFFAAAVREAFEEVGLLLADRRGPALDATEVAALRASLAAGRIGVAEVAERLDLSLRTDLLVPIARWVTPPSFPRRFDARFLAAPVPRDVVVQPDAREVVEARWMRPTDALRAMREGSIGLWLPTASALGVLEDLSSAAALASWPRLGRSSLPVAVPVADGVHRLDQWSAAGVPGRYAAGAIVGRRAAVVVDPADALPGSLDALVAQVSRLGMRIDAVAVTRVDAAHAAAALDLCDRIGVPAYCGRGGAGWLPAPFLELDDGETVPAGDVPLVVTALDAADRGRIALASTDLGIRIDDAWTADRPVRRP